jgi:uncharacterized protein (DUF2235 family)
LPSAVVCLARLGIGSLGWDSMVDSASRFCIRKAQFVQGSGFDADILSFDYQGQLFGGEQALLPGH